MPPRWPRKPDRNNDPDYRRLEDRINFAVHVALSAACNSGVWFFHNFRHADWPWINWFSAIWISILLLHGVYIFAIADYSPTPSNKSSSS
ncbi:MAG: hypothetical protein WBA13_06710 [Microcoleaceae cyanobacterium]